jgi:hypothetical protein
MTNFQESLVTGIAGGIIAGLGVYFIQFLVERRKQKKLNSENKKVGSGNDKYIDEDFLNNYIPGSVSIEKILQDFGQPNEKYEQPATIKWDNNKDVELSIYQYKFVNAIILFSTFKNETTIISITVNSNFSKTHPVKCRFTFADDDVYFGKAKVNHEILQNKTHFEKETYINWTYSAIQAKFFYREIKHLTFTYIVCDFGIENDVDMLNKTIDQLCVSANADVYPVIYFYDMI